MGLLLHDSLYEELPCTLGLGNVSHKEVVSSYEESCNNKPMYGYMLPNLSPSPNLYKVQSVYNNNVAS